MGVSMEGGPGQSGAKGGGGPEGAGPALTPESVGVPGSTFPIQLSTRFLEHFSEQLYSSPQKAFEELISNGWDAGATLVDVKVADDLASPAAALSVFDNGASMDEEGLKQLWKIAFSPKTATPVLFGRPVIGKFGIGKLATYVLAGKLTYLCKAADGIIRRVTMDYGELDRNSDGTSDRLINDIELQIFTVDEAQLEEAFSPLRDSAELVAFTRGDLGAIAREPMVDEFQAVPRKFDPPSAGTWTLVVLSDLKPTARNLKVGVLRRMLESALPLGSDMAIRLNGDLLDSSKVDAEVLDEWRIGPDLGITEVRVEAPQDDAIEGGETATPKATPVLRAPDATEVIPIEAKSDPVPHVVIPGIGVVTGQVRLYIDRITGGKSDERGASNGYHVNVLGRVINQRVPSFGEDNLSHAAWSRFRMAVRADGLNGFLTTDREKLQERREVTIFRAFLRAAFNKARVAYDSDANSALPHAGDVLVQSLGVLSLSPLRNVVSETLLKGAPLPDMFDETGVTDREGARASWRTNTADNIKNALGDVKYERVADDSFAKFRLADNTIVVNKDHPFVAEHSRSKAEKELLRTMAMVNLLSDVFALDIGVLPPTLARIRDYRDHLLRYRALVTRESGTFIASLLLRTQHDSDHSKRLEAVLSDALRYLGFDVRDIATSGEPEGIASAFPLPTGAVVSRDDPHPPMYTFSFDAKSSKHDAASTGNLHLDGIVEHRNRYKANYALVVAPDFNDGAVSIRCAELGITPIRARDLGRLLEYTVEYGAIPLRDLREIFELHDPDQVGAWVDALEERLRTKRVLTIDIFLRALENLKGKVPDVLAAGVIAYECREKLDAPSVTDEDVIGVARGLQILVPDLVGVSDDKIVVNASSERVAAAVAAQLERLRSVDA